MKVFISCARAIAKRKQPRQRRQQKCHKTKGFINKAMTLHVRYTIWHISSSFAKHRRELTDF